MLVWLLLGLPPLLLLRWADQPGHDVPKWLLLLSAAPLFVGAFLTDDSEDSRSRTSRAVGNFLLLVMGLAGMAFGVVGFALKDTPSLLGLFAWMFPVGVIATVAAVVRGLR